MRRVRLWAPSAEAVELPLAAPDRGSARQIPGVTWRPEPKPAGAPTR